MKDKPTLLEVTLPILQGLLASGHFTVPETADTRAQSIVHDNGEDWNDSVGAKYYYSRLTSVAIEEALELAKELIAQVELDEQNSEEA